MDLRREGSGTSERRCFCLKPCCAGEVQPQPQPWGVGGLHHLMHPQKISRAPWRGSASVWESYPAGEGLAEG